MDEGRSLLVLPFFPHVNGAFAYLSSYSDKLPPGIATNFGDIDWIYAEDFFNSVLTIRNTQLKDFSPDYILFRISPSSASAFSQRNLYLFTLRA